MFEDLWWQGFFTAVGLYCVFLMGQIIGYYKKNQEQHKDDNIYNDGKW